VSRHDFWENRSLLIWHDTDRHQGKEHPMAVQDTDTAARPNFLRGFIDHPASVNETYLQHAGFAFGFAGRLFLASMAALIHAIIPPLFETTASRMIRQMHARIEARHSNAGH
jgi:hypothetical protein